MARPAACYGGLVKIAVIIPTRNEAQGLAAAIRSARAADAEIYVVDAGSEDATQVIARDEAVHMVESPAGRAAQLQAGVVASSEELLLFLHADTRLPVGYADHIRRVMLDPEVVAGAFSLRFDQRSFGMRIVEWGAERRNRYFCLPYGDQGIFIRRAALEACGGIPQAILMEDLDLVERAKRLGKFVILDAKVVTSARRYQAGGVFRTWCKHALAVVAWRVGIPRERIAKWVGR